MSAGLPSPLPSPRTQSTYGVGSAPATPASTPRGGVRGSGGISPRALAQGLENAELEGARELPNSFDASELDAQEEQAGPVERFLRHAGSEVAVQRLVQARLLAEAVGAEGAATALPQVLPALADLAEDDDDEIREVIATQLAGLAACCAAEGEDAWDAASAGGHLVGFTKLLDAAAVLMADDVDEVASEAVKAFGALCEHAPPKGHARCVACLKGLAGDVDGEARAVALSALKEGAPHMGPRMACLQLAPICFEARTDAEPLARAALARALPAVMSSAADGDGEAAEDVHERLLRVFMELASDSVWSVRKASAEAIVDAAAACDQEQCVELLDLFELLANDMSGWVRTSALKSLAGLVARLGADEVTPDVVSYFTAMSDPEQDGAIGPGAPGSNVDLSFECAFALPAMALTLGSERWEELEEAFGTLVEALQWKVRKSLASSLHELARVVGPDIAHRSLSPALARFTTDLDEVAMIAIRTAPKFAAQLRPADASRVVGTLPYARIAGGAGRPEAAGGLGSTERCNNWRLRAALAESVTPLATLSEPAVVEASVLPAAMALLRDPVAAVRSRAATSLPAVLAMLVDAQGQLSGGVIEALRGMALSSNYRERQLYARLCAGLAGAVGAELLVHEFIPMLLLLAQDPVPNVRLELARALAEGSLAEHALLGMLPDVLRTLEELEADPDADTSIQAALGAR